MMNGRQVFLGLGVCAIEEFMLYWVRLYLYRITSSTSYMKHSNLKVTHGGQTKENYAKTDISHLS
jgi:hypothetical protein